MVSLAQRRVDVSFLAAVLELVVILVASAILAGVSGHLEFIGAAGSGTVAVGGSLVVLRHRLQRDPAASFQPEAMPAIVVGLVAARVISVMLPESYPDISALSLELLFAVAVGGAFGFVFSLPVVRNATGAVAKALI